MYSSFMVILNSNYTFYLMLVRIQSMIILIFYGLLPKIKIKLRDYARLVTNIIIISVMRVIARPVD